MTSQIALVIIAFTNKTQHYTAQFARVTLKRTTSRKETFSATYSSPEKCECTVTRKKFTILSVRRPFLHTSNSLSFVALFAFH